MFWNTLKAKGKLYLCAIFSLCAVLLGCTVFAFAGIFGGTSKLTNENNSQNGGTITANAAISGSGTSASPYVISGTCAEMATGWNTAISASVSGKKKVYINLGSNWTADTNTTYTRAFGTSGSGILNGRLEIPAGADIVLNLNGKTLSRGLTEARSSGEIFGINSKGVLEIKGTGTVTGGMTTGSGGVFIVNGGKLTLSGGTFKANHAQTGGVVYAYNNANVTIAGATITENTTGDGGKTTGSGGGVYGTGAGTVVTMSSGTISKNCAWKGGGVGMYGGATFNMSGGTIDSNTYGTQGGGVWIWHNLYKTTFNMTGGTISNNKVITGCTGGGGGVWTDYYGRINISAGNILNNEGYIAGGICMSGYMTETDKSAEILTITGGKISGNKATTSAGGGIYIGSPNVYPINVSISNCEISNNTANTDGGGVYITGNQTSYKGTIKFTGNVNINNNTATNGGGGLYVIGNHEVTTSSGFKVYDNTATSHSGGIYVGNYVTFNFYGGDVSTNKGGGYGFFYDRLATVKIQGNPYITDNGSAKGNIGRNNENNYLVVTGALTHTSSSSGIWLGNDFTGQITSGYGTYNSSRQPSLTFVDSSDDYANREIKLVGGEAVNVAKGTDTSKMVTTPVGQQLVYSGASQQVIKGYNSTYMNAPTSITSGASLSGTNIVATNAGTYSATFSLKTGYKWADGTTAAKTVSGLISKVSPKLTTFENKSVTYTGSAQSLTAPTATPGTGVTWAITYKQGETAVTSPTNVGTYTATATPTYNADNYQTVATRTATLTITNATITGTVSDISWTYDGKTHEIMNDTGTVTSGNTKHGIKLTVVNSQTQTWKFSTTANQDWTKVTANNKLTFKNACAETTVYYQVSAPNHTTKTGSFKVTVNKKSLTDASTAYSGTYNGSAHGITVSASGFITGETFANAAGKTIKYRTASSGDYTLTTAPTRTDAGTTTVYYQITFTNYGTVTGSKTITVNKKALTANSTASNKTYNGNTTATVTKGTLSGVVTGDTVDFTAAGTFADKNVGTGKNVTIKYTLSGTDAGNYSMADKTVTANITKKSLTANSTASNKTYNGNTTATVTKGTLSGVVTGDTVDFTAAGTFADKNVGTGKNVTVKYTLSGTDAGNYSMADKTVTANITQKALTAASTAANKVYNGNTVATVTLGTVSGLVTGDNVTITPSGTFADKNVGNNKAVTISYALSGTDAGNYSMANKTGVTANITKAGLTDASTGYTGTYDAGKHSITVKLNGFISGETLANASGATIKYGTEAGTYNLTVNPEITNVTDSKTIYYQVTFDNYETVTGSKAVTLGKAQISGVTWDRTSYSYDGTGKQPKIETVTTTATAGLPADVSEMFSYSGGATVQGSHTAVAELKAEYAANYEISGAADKKTVTTAFNIGLAEITLVAAAAYVGTYDGKKHRILTSMDATTVGSADNNLKWWYSASDLGAEDAGWTEFSALSELPEIIDVSDTATYYFRITADNHETRLFNRQARVNAKSLGTGSGAVADIRTDAIPQFIYDGTAKTPAPVVYDNATNRITSADYSYTYNNNIAAGVKTAVLTITGANNYSGSFQILYSIDPREISVGTITVNGIADTVYNHGEQKESPELTDTVVSNAVLAAGTDYTVTYETSNGAAATDFTNVGTIKVIITGTGNYSGSRTEEYKITPYDLSGAGVSIASVANQTYTGSGVTPEPAVTVTFGSAVTLVKGSDFGYGYNDNVNAGTAHITVTGSGNYSGTASITFVIEPKEITTISGITATDKVYDGGNGYENAVQANGDAAGIDYSGAVIAGNADGANLTVSAATGVFDSVHAGQRTVTVTVTALGGAAAGNYKLAAGGVSVTAVAADGGVIEILQREIEIKWGELTHVYDGKSYCPAAEVNNLVTGDTVTLVTRLKGAATAVAPGPYTAEIASDLSTIPGDYKLPAAIETVFNITTEGITARVDTDSLTQVYDGAEKAPKLEQLDVESQTWSVIPETNQSGTANYEITYTAVSGGELKDGKPAGAGEYKATIKLSPNYSWSDVQPGDTREYTFKITPATVTGIVLTGKTETYSGSNYELAADWSGVRINGEAYGRQPDGVTVTYLYDGAATAGAAKAGEHTVTARFSVNGNYNDIADITAQLKIEKAEYALDGAGYGVAFADGSASYTGGKHKLEITGVLPSGVSVVYSYEKDGESYGADGVTSVGEYTVIAKFVFDDAADADNYKLTYNGAEISELRAKLNIGKQAASVSGIIFEDGSAEYDGNVHRLQVSGEQEGITGVTYEYRKDGVVVSTDGVRDAGEYSVTAHFSVDSNYDAASAPDITKTLTISKAHVTVTADGMTIVYGDDPAAAQYTATYTGLVSGDNESVLGTAVIRVNSGKYAIYGDAGTYEGAIEISGLTSVNYEITYVPGTLTVRPRVITVTWYNSPAKGAQDLAYVYDGTEHTPYAEVTNAVHGDTVTVTVTGGRTDAGVNYTAEATGVSNGNYCLPVSGLKATFDVLPQPKSGVIIWDNGELYYNGSEQAPKAYYYENENDNSPVELTVTTDKRAVNAGSYVATAALGANYTLTGDRSKSFEILKRKVYIEIGDLTAMAGNTDVSGVSWSYVAGSLEFAAGEVYTIKFSVAGEVTGAGVYPIRGEFISNNAGNYEVVFSGSYAKAGSAEDGKCGTLTVTEGEYDMSRVTFTGTEVTYDGAKHTVTATGLPVGVTATYEYSHNGWSIGADGAADAGEYEVTVRFTGSAEYGAIADMTVTLKIKKASLTVKANDNSIVYGELAADAGVTYSIDAAAGVLEGTLKVSADYEQYGAAGKYRLVPSGLTSVNYEITYVPGTLTVQPREITVTWYSDSSATESGTFFSYDYDGAEHVPYAVASGMLRGDTLQLTVSGAQSAAGLNYTASITGVSNGNYAVKAQEASVKYSIIEKNTVIWDNTEITYNGQNQKPSAVYYDAQGAEHTLDVEVRDASGAVLGEYKNKGTYTAYIVNAPADITGAMSREYVIAAKAVTVTAGSGTLTYGDVESKLAGLLAQLKAALGGADGFVSADGIPVELECKVTDTSNIGVYTVTGRNSGNANYVITVVGGTLEIVKADVDESGISFAGGASQSVEYDGKAHGLEISALPAGVTKVTYTYYKDGAEVAAGEVIGTGIYTVEAHFEVDNNHNGVTGVYSAQLEITAAELSGEITFTGGTYVYDGREHSLYVSGDMTGITGVEYEYDLNGTTVSGSGVRDAGVYNVTVRFTVAENYRPIPAKVARLEITQAALTVTAENGAVVYGETPDANGYGYTVTGLGIGDDAAAVLGTLTYAYGHITGAGEYAITVSGVSATKNYTVTYKGGKLTVSPYTLKAENVDWYDKQGGAVLTGGKFEYTYTPGTQQQPYAEAKGLINGESVTFTVTGGQINAGYGYEAKITGITGAAAGNYMLPAEGLTVTFDIVPRPLTGKIVWDNTPIYYDGTEQLPRAYYYDADGTEYEFTNVTADRESIKAGRYTASVSTGDINYTLTGETGISYEILARKVYVEIGDMQISYGETPNFGAVSYRTVNGSTFIPGDSYAITFTGDSISGVGAYAIRGTFTGADAANYEVIFSGSWASAGADNGKHGTLKVVRASYDMSGVTFAGTEAVYDGAAHKLVINGLPAGVTAESEYVKDGFIYADGAVVAGEYTVTVRFTGAAEYEPIADMGATLTIKKASLTIKANDATITYGGAAEHNGVSYTGFAAGESENTHNALRGGLEYSYSYTQGNNVGEYTISVTGYTSDNYEITYKSGTLKVEARELTVTWYDDETMGTRNFVYPNDGEEHVPYAVAGGLVNGDAVQLGVSGAKSAQGINYVATAVLGNTNYKLPTDGSAQQQFTIMPKAGSIVWDNTPIYYNGKAQTPKAYYFDEQGEAHEIEGVGTHNGAEAIDQGDYTATVIFDGEARYCPFTILPLEVTVVIGSPSAATEYGKAPELNQSLWTYGAGSAQFISGSPIRLETTAVAGSRVGSYAITGVCTDANYKVTFVDGTLTICKANIDLSGVNYGAQSAVYDGNVHGLEISGLPAGITGVVCTYEKDGVSYGHDGVREAGEYTVTVTFAVTDTHNYNAAGDITVTFTVTRPAADVSGVVFADGSAVYDGTAKSLKVTGSAVGVTGVTYKYYESDGVTELTGGAIDAGKYVVKAEFTFDGNYDGSGVTAKTAELTITQASLTVTANAHSVTYGDAISGNNGYTVTGLAAGDSESDVLGTVTVSSPDYKVTDGAAEYAGAIKVSGNTSHKNYTITYVSGTLTVMPRVITVTGWQKSATDASAVLEYEYAAGTSYIPYAIAGNTVNGDVIELTVETAKDSAGTNYTATVTGVKNPDGSAAVNYMLPASRLQTVFSIKYTTPVEYEIIWNYTAQEYDGSAHKPSAEYYDSVTDGYVTISPDDIEVYDAQGNAVQAIHAGKYTAKVTDTAVAYTNAADGMEFEILKRTVQVTVGDASGSYGETPDVSKAGWSYAGGREFLAGDAYAITFATTATAAAPAGIYPIVGTYSGSADYEVIFTGGSYVTGGADNGRYGTYEIVKAVYDMSRVTFTGTEAVYDGTEHTIAASGLPAGLTASYEYTRNGWSLNGGKDAGEYTVTVRFTGDANHEPVADMTATLKVSKASLKVTANAHSIEYGDAPEANGVSYTGFAAGDSETAAGVLYGTLAYEYSYVTGGAAGVYRITPKGLGSDNYDITYVSGELKVEKRVISVIWYNDERMNSQSLKYASDGTEHLPYAEAGNVIAGDSVELTVSGAQSAAGINYKAAVTAVSNANYRLPDGGAEVSFDIIPEANIIVWETAPFVYDGTVQKPRAYYFTANGEQVELNVSVKANWGDSDGSGTSVYAGKYMAVASLRGGNVTLTGEFEHEFEIAKRKVTVVINDAGSAYGEDVVLNGWHYGEGSAEFVTGAPVYLQSAVTKATPVGSYAITGGLYAGFDNSYDVDFISGTYTVEKAVVKVPEILAKEYTGGQLKADVTDTAVYRVYQNDGGINAGEYKVILEIRDYDNYKWSVNGEDVRSANYTVMFEITKAENVFTAEFAALEIKAGQRINIIEPVSKYGSAAVEYYKDAACTEKVTVTDNVWNAVEGTYYAKVTVAGTDNYGGLEQVYAFTVTGKLELTLYWGTLEHEYDGSVWTPKAYVMLDGRQIELKVTGGQSNAGTYNATVSLSAADGTDLSKYTFATGAGSAPATVQYTVAPKEITVHIVDAGSEYGSALVDVNRLNIENCVIDGSLVGTDNRNSLNLTFTCNFGSDAYAPAGSYAIEGSCGNGNYKVTFAGADGSGNGTYTVREATISVLNSESTWFDEQGVISEYQDYFITLGETDENGAYRNIRLKGGQEARITYSTIVAKYDSAVHDGMPEERIMMMFADGGQTSAPKIVQGGSWVVYYRIEADSHTTKYGIWKVLIEDPDNYVIITFTKPYKVQYGDAAGRNILPELVAQDCIELSGKVITDTATLLRVAEAYAYEDVAGENGTVNVGTAVDRYTIRLVFNTTGQQLYGDTSFKYSATNTPNSDTNLDKFEVIQRKITVNWANTEFTEDGEKHLPEITLKGFVGGQEIKLSGYEIGTAKQFVLENGDIINVTVRHTDGDSGMVSGSYTLKVEIDNANYTLDGESGLVTITPAKHGVTLPNWAIILIAAGGAVLLLIVIIAIVVAKKRKGTAAVAAEDLDGFNDDYTGV